GDSLNVQVLPFDTSAAQAAAASSAAAAKAAAAAAAHKKLMGELKTGGIIVAVLVIALIAWLGARRRRKNRGEFEELEPQPEGDDLDRSLATLHDGPMPDNVPREPAMRQASVDEAQATANREAIAELAHDQPEDVARLLRSWMNSKGS